MHDGYRENVKLGDKAAADVSPIGRYASHGRDSSAPGSGRNFRLIRHCWHR
jgi:hypothetical protein